MAARHNPPSLPGLDRWVDAWGGLFEQATLPRTAGRIWGWLLLCEPPEQTAGELCRALDLTKGSISTNTRLLERFGLLERAGSRGSKQMRYRIRPDAYERLARTKIEATVVWRELAERGVAMLPTGDARAARVRELRDFYKFAEREQVAALERWRARRRSMGRTSRAK